MKKVFLRRALPFALSFAMTFNMSAFTGVARAEEGGEKVDDSYSLVWSDEFDGDSLNTDDWNVEQHEPGWVNAELQRYTALDEGNIEVSDGTLKIKPHVTGGEIAKENGEAEDTDAPDISEVEKTEVTFDITVPASKETSTAAIQINFGKIDDSEEGTAPATVVISDLSLKDITEGEDNDAEHLRSADFANSWEWYFGSNAPGEGTIDYFDGFAKINVVKAGEANWNVQLQQSDLELKAGHSYRFTIKAAATANRKIELSILDPQNGYYWYGGSVGYIPGADIEVGGSTAPVSSDREITSGRITTQGKHDFTYGRFETRAKVPVGKGYLPAFWLMATNESYYGQWPKCGEIDICEVMGQNVNKSYHTIHYGYNSGTGHKENQGTKVQSENSYADDFHVFAVEWEPGLITWYVDDEKVYETRDWYTGTDDNNQITYPAPFDQNFYIILNLAVGGSWVGYPDDSVYEAMNDQSFEVDYVRVYQKPQEEYERLENEAKKPEKEEKTFREPDESGNYVVNGDFSQSIAFEGADGDVADNFKLHLESDGEGTSYEINDGEITIYPAAEGSQNYSVQLKQPGIAMYKGWEYELSFDAKASEARDIVVDIEGPDRSWVRYLSDTNVSLTTEKANYILSFTMNEKSDTNGCLEFNLGKLGSTAAVTLSNIRLTHKSGEEVKEENFKEIRPDGNYIYNGAFDQGEKRLGYWEFSDEDAEYISVVNAGGKRELKVTVPEGKSVKVSQSGLNPIVRGKYEISFDVRSEDGTGEVSVDAAGASFAAAAGTDMKTFSKKFDVTSDKTREESFVSLTFDKAGTYYVDNVAFTEAALLKNGSFNTGLAAFSPYVYDTVKASYVIDSMNGNDNAFAITIEDTIADSSANEWYVQLNQDGITLEEGKTYRLSFKAKSSIDRVISYCMQEFEGSWTNYSGTGPVEIGPEYRTFSKEFTMNHPTDTNTRFNITLGSVGGVRITEKHDVYIDDIVLEEVEAAEEPGEEPENPEDPDKPVDPETPDPGVTPQPGDTPDPGVTPSEPEKPSEPSATLVTRWGTSYYITEDGEKLTGIYTIDGNDYLFGNNGAMKKNHIAEYEGKSYHADANGVLTKNELFKSWGTIYYFGEDGAMVKDKCVTVDGYTYYLQPGGGAAKNQIVAFTDGSRYFDGDGHMVTGLMKSWGTVYYFEDNGVMATDKLVTVDGETYYISPKGYAVKGEFVRFEDGVRFFDSNCHMLKDTTMTYWFVKYTFDENGILVE